jgi:predicted transcriptional regulator
VRLRDITERVGITERAVRRIIGELVDGGYVSRRREGRRNVYVVHGERSLRHPMESHRDVRAMLAGLVNPTSAHVTKDTLR